MELKIYSGDGRLKLTVEPRDNGTQVEEIQAGNVLNISFILPKRVSLDVNDYVDFINKRYWITEKYNPEQKSTIEWEYSLRFYGLECLISRFLVLNTTDGGNEPVFTLTAHPREHVALIVKSINAGFGTSDWKVGAVESGDNIVVDYRGKYCDAGLKAVADAIGAEYWIEGTTVNLCRCEHGELITLGYQNGLTKIHSDLADNTKVYTRLFPVGSSKNIDPAKYGHSRLQLPGGMQYVDMNTDKYGIIHHYEENAFASIFPRYIGTVSSVRVEQHTDDDGNRFDLFYFKDDALPFDPNQYTLGTRTKRITFQEGSELAGQGNDDNGTHYFEVDYSSYTSEFKIRPQFNDSGVLPGNILIPKVGDKYIPWNMLMPDEYYALAEAEFLKAAHEYNRKHSVDASCYKASTDYIEIEKRGLELHVGQRVRLESLDLFPETGYKDSRITKITRKVNRISQMEIEISEVLSAGPFDKIQSDIDDVKSYVELHSDAPDIIRTGDNTPFTDNNLLSALRTRRDFMSRQKDDRSAGKVGADKGFEAGRYVAGLSGGRFDGQGNLEAESGVFRSFVKIFELIYNRLNALEGDVSFADSGTIDTITENADGSYTAVMRRRWEGDFTAFQPGDIIYGYANDIAVDQESGELREGSRGLTWFKAWAVVRDADRVANTLTLARYGDADVPAGRNFAMTSGMTVSRWGNDIEPTAASAAMYPAFIHRRADGGYVNTRQQSFYMSCEQGHLMELVGVDSPMLRPGNYGTVLGQLPEGLVTDPAVLQLLNSGQPYLYARGIVVQDLIRLGYQGLQVRTPNFRGTWSAEAARSETEYYRRADDLVDIVSHDGALWQCASSHAGSAEPSDMSADWVRLTDFNVRVWSIVPSTNVIYIRTGSYSTSLLECRVTVDNGIKAVEIDTPEQLDTYGMKLCFSLDGVTYKEFWVRRGDTVGGLSTSDGESLEMSGNNVPWSQINDFIWLYLIDTVSGERAASYRVAVVRDGSDGTDGNDGETPPHQETRYTVTNSAGTVPALQRDKRDPSTDAVKWVTIQPQATSAQYVWQTTAMIDADDALVAQWGNPVRLTGMKGGDGKPGKDGIGRLAYPAGRFDPNVTYVSTDTQQPVVLDGAQYYILKPGKTYRGAAAPSGRETPSKDHAAGGDAASWEWMERMRYVFSEVLFAEMAKLGSFVVSGDWFISTRGVYDKDGETDLESEAYQHFGDGFTPNLAINARTGKIIANCGEFRGWLRLSEVVITPDNIAGHGSVVEEGDGYVTYDIHCTQTGTMLRFRGDFTTGFGSDGKKRCRIHLRLPYMDYFCTDGKPDDIRSYCGSSAVIINESVTVTDNVSYGQTSMDRGQGGTSRPTAYNDLIVIGAISIGATGNGTFNHDIPLKPGCALHLRAELGYAEELAASDTTVMYEQVVWRTGGVVKMRKTILDSMVQ